MFSSAFCICRPSRSYSSYLALLCLVLASLCFNDAFGLLDQSEINALKALRYDLGPSASPHDDEIESFCLTAGNITAIRMQLVCSDVGNGNGIHITYASLYDDSWQVDVFSNGITGLIWLKELSLTSGEDTHHADFSSISRMTNLTKITLGARADPTLTQVGLDFTRMVNLEYVDIRFIGFKLFPNFTGLPKLSTIALDFNFYNVYPVVAHKEALENLPSLENLKIYLASGSSLSYLSDLSSSTKLTQLDLTHSNMTFFHLSNTDWTRLTKVEYLYLDNNPGLARLPPSMSGLTSLQQFKASGCSFSGSDSLFDFSNTKINNIEIRGNTITDFPQGLTNLPSTSRDIVFNALYQPLTSIPSSFASNHFSEVILANTNCSIFPIEFFLNSALTYFSWTGNGREMASPASVQWGSAWESTIEYLALENLGLTAPFPSPSSSMPVLSHFMAPGNHFTGSFASDFFSKTPALLYLDLSGSSLTSSIPSSIQVPRFRVIDLSGNRLSGTIPSGIFSSKALGILKLHRNNLHGPIPDTIQQATALETLNLSNNNLFSLPGDDDIDWTRLTELTEIYLSNNPCLSSTIPSSWFDATIPKLEAIYGDGCAFYGDFPQLVFTPNSTSGWPWPVPFLSRISFNDNYLNGTIAAPAMPPLDGPALIVTLSLRDNFLSGTIPSEMRYLSRIDILDLSFNNLSGTISPYIGGLTQLVELRLNDNWLEGGLLDTSRLTDLELLNLSSNMLDICLTDPAFNVSGMTINSCNVANNLASGACNCLWYVQNLCIADMDCPSSPTSSLSPSTSRSDILASRKNRGECIVPPTDQPPFDETPSSSPSSSSSPTDQPVAAGTSISGSSTISSTSIYALSVVIVSCLALMII